MKKKFKEFIPLWDFVKEKKTTIIISSILIFIVELVGLLYGYLNGKAVEEVTKNNLEQAIAYLIIYLLIGIVFNVIIYQLAKNRKFNNKKTRI